MPLMQFGAINTGRYIAGAMPQSTNLFSWPMNNYWVTNFNADQRGWHSWRYYLTTSSDVSNGFATRFGWGCRVPFLTSVLPGSGTGDNNWEGSFITGWPSNIILLSSEPVEDGKSCIIHLRETDGRETSVNLTNGVNWKALSAVEVDVTRKPVLRPYQNIGPLESKFYRIVFVPWWLNQYYYVKIVRCWKCGNCWADWRKLHNISSSGYTWSDWWCRIK